MKLSRNNYNKKNLGGLILVGILLLSVGGVSFAFFISRVLQSGTGTSTSVTTATINGATINIEGKLEFNDPDILPGHQNISSVKVTATGNNELIPYNLIWNGTNTLNTPLNYKVYKTSEQISVSATCNKDEKAVDGVQQLSEECTISNLDKLGTEISSGTISKAETESKTILVKDEFVTATSDGQKVYYYVVLEYPNLDEPQNLDIGGIFSGKVTIEESNAKPDINILAAYVIQDDGTYKETNDIPQSGYKVNTEKSTCSNGASVRWDYYNKELITSNLTKSGTSCYLYFDKYVPTASETILAKITVKETTPSYGSTATSDEGVYKIADDMYNGDSYVWRGAVKNNWVKFANMYWRIIRINGDGSIRMIYTANANLDNVTVDANGITTTGEGTQIQKSKYNSSYNRSEYVGYTYKEGYQRPSDTTSVTETASSIKLIVDEWYSTNIGNNDAYASHVADGKYCNDRNTASGYTWSSSSSSDLSYAARGRLESSKAPTLSCSDGDIYALKAGLITVDEVSMAGGLYGTANSNYYLYTNQWYWTMSPSYYPTAAVFVVDSDGRLSWLYVNDTRGVRPVINLRSDTIFKVGSNGTYNNPYEVI